MSFDVANGSLNVSDSHTELRQVGRKAVVNRKPCEPGLSQRLKKRLDVKAAITAHPSTSVPDNDGRGLSGRLRQRSIKAQTDSVDLSVLDIRNRARLYSLATQSSCGLNHSD